MKAQYVALLLLICTVSAIADQPPAVSSGTAATVVDPYSMPPAQVASEFALIRGEQMKRYACEEKVTPPMEMEQFFAFAEKNDWDSIKGAMRVLYTMAGAYEGTTNGVPGVAKTTNDVLNLFWDYVLDTYGFAEQVHLWEPEPLSLYAKVMLKDLPPGAIIFGGTDPGRFVLTAYLAVQKEPDRFLITQNQLAVDSYMSYVRRMYGQLQIPSAEVCSNVLATYIEDARTGRYPGYSGVSFDKDGRGKLEGPQGYMTINGVLAKWIFDKNKDAHPFYVEESYVISWMYPYLSPQGLIMKLNAEPLKDLSPEVVKADQAFWDRFTTHLVGSITNFPEDVIPPLVAGKDNELISWDKAAKTKTWRIGMNHRFNVDAEARKTFSKMRSAIGGLYVFRQMFPEAEYAFKQAIALCPTSPEASFRLATAYMQQSRFSDAGKIIEEFLKFVGPDDRDRAAAFLQQIKDVEKNDNRRKELEAAIKTSPDINQAFELAEIYRVMGMQAQYQGLAANLLQLSNISSDDILRVAKLGKDAYRFDLQVQALEKYLKLKPDDVDLRIELAKCYVELKQQGNALAALQLAIRDGGMPVRERIKTDSSFEAIRLMPELQEMMK
jgi:tetratricopeptide (TPR) repeat protein